MTSSPISGDETWTVAAMSSKEAAEYTGLSVRRVQEIRKWFNDFYVEDHAARDCAQYLIDKKNGKKTEPLVHEKKAYRTPCVTRYYPKGN